MMDRLDDVAREFYADYRFDDIDDPPLGTEDDPPPRAETGRELRPCPFCGCAEQDDDQERDLDAWLQVNELPGPLYEVECFGCGAYLSTTRYQTRSSVVRAWNRRAREEL